MAPVLELDEVNNHPHNREREFLISVDGDLQPAPAPRLSRTPGQVRRPGSVRGAHTREILEELGFPSNKIEDLFGDGTVE